MTFSLKTQKLLLICVVILLAIGVRFFNYENRITFGPEQAISLQVSADYINEKPSLLGLPNVQRTTSHGHILFSGSLFNYSLVPLLLAFEYKPIPITAFFTFLNVATGVALFFVFLKLFSYRVALFSAIVFLFNDQMLDLSMYIWILHYLPLIGLLTIYLLWRMRRSDKTVYPLLLGILSGIGFNFEYFYLFTGVLLFILIQFISKRRLQVSAVFIAGAILGNAPMILFDLSNGFYHVKTVWQYFLDTLTQPGQSKIASYHFYHFWPLLALGGGWLLATLYKWNRYIAFIGIAVYLGLNLTSSRVSFSHAVAMPKGLTVKDVAYAAEVIAREKPTNFNVAALFDFDSRAHPLRYLLQYRHDLKPNGVEAYPQSQTLYVFASKDYQLENATVYEVKSFGAEQITVLEAITPQYTIFKLTK